MKTLYLIRHSKAAMSAPTDFERELTEQGKEALPRVMGNVLADQNPAPDYLISSPARRTFTTSFIVAKALGLETGFIETDKQLFHATFEDIYKFTCDLDDKYKSVIMVAHNPAISQLANHLLGTYNIMFSPCTICAIDLEINTWKACSEGLGIARFFETPEKHIQ